MDILSVSFYLFFGLSFYLDYYCGTYALSNIPIGCQSVWSLARLQPDICMLVGC